MSKSAPKPRVFCLLKATPALAALQAELERLGLEFSHLPDSATCLDRIIAEAPEVLLCDLDDPAFDASDLLARVATANVNAAFVGLCSKLEFTEVLRLFREGAVDFLRVPYTPPELHATFQRALEIQRRRAPLYLVPEVQERPGAAASASEVFALVLQRVRKGQIKLPAVPAIITELRQKLVSINCRMDDIVALVQRDQMLATDILRLATSALYGSLKSKPDLRTAITRVGFREMLQLVDTVMAHRFFRMEDPLLQSAVAGLWRMSLARAYCMRALAEGCHVAPPPAPDRAYLCGLLADIGASFLLRVVVELPAERRPSSADACIAFAASHHEALGESLLGAWGLDAVVVKVAGSHHRARMSDKDPYGALCIVGTSLAERLLGEPDRLAHASHEATRYAQAMVQLGLDDDGLEAIRARVEPVLQVALGALVG